MRQDKKWKHKIETWCIKREPNSNMVLYHPFFIWYGFGSSRGTNYKDDEDFTLRSGQQETDISGPHSLSLSQVRGAGANQNSWDYLLSAVTSCSGADSMFSNTNTGVLMSPISSFLVWTHCFLGWLLGWLPCISLSYLEYDLVCVLVGMIHNNLYSILCKRRKSYPKLYTVYLSNPLLMTPKNCSCTQKIIFRLTKNGWLKQCSFTNLPSKFQ